MGGENEEGYFDGDSFVGSGWEGGEGGGGGRGDLGGKWDCRTNFNQY